MRAFRLSLALLPYLAVLGALGAAGEWYAFWVVATLTVLLVGSITFLVIRRSRRVKQLVSPPRRLSASEYAELFAKRWWVFALLATAFAVAAFLPSFRKQPAWELPVFAIAGFLATGLGVRLGARWARKQEEEFERFTRRGSRAGPHESDSST